MLKQASNIVSTLFNNSGPSLNLPFRSGILIGCGICLRFLNSYGSLGKVMTLNCLVGKEDTSRKYPHR